MCPRPGNPPVGRSIRTRYRRILYRCTSDPKLARAALEFWPELDESFEINISKMRVRLPEELRDQLKPLVQFLSRCADERYRKSSRRSDSRPPAPAPKGKRPAAAPAGAPTGTGDADRFWGAAGPTGGQDGGPRAEAPTTSGPATAAVAGTQGAPGTGPVPLAPDRRRIALEQAAQRADAVDVLDRIRAELHHNDPEVARDLGW